LVRGEGIVTLKRQVGKARSASWHFVGTHINLLSIVINQALLHFKSSSVAGIT
jgi:hypothetical protein